MEVCRFKKQKTPNHKYTNLLGKITKITNTLISDTRLLGP